MLAGAGGMLATAARPTGAPCAARGRRGTLPRTVVVALGTNWIVTTAQVRQALRILGPGRLLGLVVPRELASARTLNRRNIRAAGRRGPPLA